MFFYIENIVLWLKSGKKRILNFENNKINVITGNSKTGKTAILEIFDYCFCGSESNISDEKIGKNVMWYGMKFHINDKTYTIARGEYKNKNELSKDYYFSSTGYVPELPTSTISEKELKNIIENEFSINSDVVFPFGGKQIKQGSKISFRYFLLFNILSGDIIAHSTDYFDKMHNIKYQEALHRIFDLALSITTIENISISGNIEKEEKKRRNLEKELEKINISVKNRDSNIRNIVKKAKENKIISSDINDINECIEQLNDIIKAGRIQETTSSDNDELKKLRFEKQTIEIQINKLKQFKNTLKKYKSNLKKESDALSPIQYILKEFSNRVPDNEYLQFLRNLSLELENIKIEIKTKYPFEYDVDSKIKELEKKRKSIQEKIEIIPDISDEALTDNQRYIILGELKSNLLPILSQNFDTKNTQEKIEAVEKYISYLESKYVDPTEKRKSMINALNDYIQIYLNNVSKALGEYGDYKSDFDYKTKALRLRKPRSVAPASITSSSDHLFMHLCMFLGMHHLIMNNKNPYIIPFLIIDQPSRPYFNNKESDYEEILNSLNNKNDWSKVQSIFRLLDYFMKNILEEEKCFQIILLEHVPTDTWNNCRYINLVDVFDGSKNALIPLDDI
jgi:hypothetical protein